MPRLEMKWTILVALLLTVGPLKAQEAGKVSLALTTPVARPGGDAYINVMLSGVSVTAARVGEVREQIQFPKDRLKYVEAHIGIASELAGADLKLEVKDGPLPSAAAQEGNFYVISIVLTAKKPIPDGPLVELVFKVPEGLEDQVVFLEHKPEIKILEGNPAVGLDFDKGMLSISNPKPKKPGPGVGHEGHAM